MKPSDRKLARVVGLTFHPEYPDNLLSLAEALAENPHCQEQAAVLLVARPDNPHDENAVEVHLPGLGGCVGHLPRDVARFVSPVLRSGRWQVQAEVDCVRIDEEHPDRPGLTIRFWRSKITTNPTPKRKQR